MADTSCVTKLAEARQALHSLRTGTAVVETWTRGGIRVKYTAANLDDLRAYVDELNAECGGPGGSPGLCVPRRRPIGVQF